MPLVFLRFRSGLKFCFILRTKLQRLCFIWTGCLGFAHTELVLCLIGSPILPADWGVLYSASGLFLSHRDFGSHSMTSRLLVSLHGHRRSCLPCCQHAPAVVAVLVTHDPGEWFEATLVSLRTQDYTALSALVIDVASTDGSALRDRVGAILAARFACCAGRLEENGGFGPAANEALRSVQGLRSL